ncbi:MAG TPA: hypothetical protein VFB81_13150 [Myxococcales bacterium]|nr:hypothetical protein [Myxococcales bacterium]
MGLLTRQLGDFPFRVAETPLLMTAELRDWLARSAREIVAQLSEPARLEKLKKAIPKERDVPGMDPLPNCVQVDFALVRAPDGRIEGRVVELQAFPSLYALMSMMADAWAQTLNEVPELRADWTCFIGQGKPGALELMRRTIVGDADPETVVLVDFEPENQKTSPDFWATQKMFGVDPVCVTKLVKRGHHLFRQKDGREIQVNRIYNRMVFDELDVKGVKPPFDWRDDLGISWCSHPNWYWVWSKYALPFLDHPAIPRARFLSELETLPEDLSRYVLKPLFSFAGAGVVIDVTREVVDKVPVDQRDGWVLQEKIEYAPAISMPDGNGVKVEVRMMLLRPPDAKTLTPILPLVRLSRGKMLGVDFNKNLTWVGGTVGIFQA